jgi:drug/metabolite transporter (DMT)-like permease
VGVLLALASALSYGLSDVVGGVVARRMHALQVAFLGQLGGLATAALAAPFTAALPGPQDLLWGALSGLGTAAGMALLFQGMRRGAMSVVVPISAVGGVALPVLVGATLLGDRPSWPTWLGVAVTLPALWLVSRAPDSAHPTGPAVRNGIGAGAGIAIQYLALSQTTDSAGLWPVLAGRVTAVLAVGIAATTQAPGNRPRDAALWAGASGVLAAAALAAYQVAVRTEYVTVAVVLSSLYPVVPVAVGITALHERVSAQQKAGMAAALAAAVLIALT